MPLSKTIKSALISVYYKDKLAPVIESLHRLGVTLYSTGGTRNYIEGLNIPVLAVEDLTSYPSILSGRVKTLHPKVFGGILARREQSEDLAQLAQFDIPTIDLVIVDLYPFEETVLATDIEADIIEKIDIGGVSLIRAAAKNFNDVCIIASKDAYDTLLDILQSKNGETTLDERKNFAKNAFKIIAEYDQSISAYFNDYNNYSTRYEPKFSMRYGENPHQKAAFYGKLNDIFEQLHGKDISFNNLTDIESCMYVMEDFYNTNTQDITCAIIKHTNTCGIATAQTLQEAYSKALAADPVSAFGGVIICNTEVDFITAQAMHNLFFEVLIAPNFNAQALELLKVKKNRIILKQLVFTFPDEQFKSMLNGILVQSRNKKITAEQELQFVTDKKPDIHEIEDLLFAEKVVKHLKSNGIALVKNAQLIGSGTGQTSRVDSLNQALAKAKAFGFDVQGAVMASEAFFPFPDCVEIAQKEGIKAVIQPGGSIKDGLSIDFCNQNNMAMVFTGTRHFKH